MQIRAQKRPERYVVSTPICYVLILALLETGATSNSPRMLKLKIWKKMERFTRMRVRTVKRLKRKNRTWARMKIGRRRWMRSYNKGWHVPYLGDKRGIC